MFIDLFSSSLVVNKRYASLRNLLLHLIIVFIHVLRFTDKEEGADKKHWNVGLKENGDYKSL